MLSNAGLQVPVIPLFEVVSNALKASPEQIAGIWVKLGVISVIILTLPVAISLEISEGKITLMSSKKLPNDPAGWIDLKRMV